MKFGSEGIKDLFDHYCSRAAAEIAILADKSEESSIAVSAALWLAAAGIPVSAVKALDMEIPALTQEQLQLLDALFRERIAGKPLGHLTKRQHFMNIEMLADPAALIPRKETELVAALGLKSIADAMKNKQSIKVIDICTGSGNLACTFARYFPSIKIFAADLSEEAVAFANKNALFTGVAANTEFRSGDLLSPFDTPDFMNAIDVLTCNPPYISSKKLEKMPAEIISFEPEMAFNGGIFGVAIFGKLVKESVRYLVPGGYLCLEVGLGQGLGVIKMFERTGVFSLVETLADEQGNIRAIRMRRIEAHEKVC